MPTTPYAVTGKLVSSAGAALPGQVSFRLSWQAWLADDTATVLSPDPIYASLAQDGTYTVELYANIDLLPANSYYTVVEVANGVKDTPYTIVVPHGGGAVASLITSSPALPAQYVQGPPGGVGQVAVNGSVLPVEGKMHRLIGEMALTIESQRLRAEELDAALQQAKLDAGVRRATPPARDEPA